MARIELELANWNWKAVRQFVSERFGVRLSRSSCLNYPRLHEGRVCTAWDLPSSVPRSAWSRLMRPREAFVAEYAALRDEAGRTGGKIFFVDEVHFRADAELRGKWALKGEPAPRFHGVASARQPVARPLRNRTGSHRRGAENRTAGCQGMLVLSAEHGKPPVAAAGPGTGGEPARPVNVGWSGRGQSNAVEESHRAGRLQSLLL